ncbi:MAG: hypothetical protein L6416_07350 [Candidatus Omnitrophica bacterium]|nr:hypothetical protein [Candidatus Omnitrophota bacterium]
MLKNKRGILLIAVFMVIAVVSILLGAFLFRNVWDTKNAVRYKQSIIALHCAEAGLDKAIAKLPTDVMAESNVALTDNNNQTLGEYAHAIAILEMGKRWRVESWGYVPDQGQPQAVVHLEAYISKKDLPDSFWDNAIYTSGNVRINGVAFDINGDILYAGSLLPAILDEDCFTGTATNDTSISPFIKLDYDYLRAIAATQIKPDGSDNIYTAAEIVSKFPPLPASFWFDQSDPNPANWIPNVVYVETDLVLNGNIGTIGGFLVVVGDVISEPDETTSTTINGNGHIDGCVYSTGEFRVNGGGETGLSVLGGAWSGSDGVRINGSVDIGYHKPYMDSIRYIINPSSTVQLISWRKL